MASVMDTDTESDTSVWDTSVTVTAAIIQGTIIQGTMAQGTMAMGTATILTLMPMLLHTSPVTVIAQHQRHTTTNVPRLR